MPEYRFQRYRGAWAISAYADGERISRCRLESADEKAARQEFADRVAELTRPPASTVADLWAAYRHDREGRVIAGNMEWSGKPILAFFGALKPDEITTDHCRRYTRGRRSWTDTEGKTHTRHDGTIWTELGHLRIVLVWAEKARLIDHAPSIERPPQPDPDSRHLTRDEVERLLDAAGMPHIRLFIMLAISTAGRNSALLELTWDQVDFVRGVVDLRTPGSARKKGRGTPAMSDSLRAALLEAQAGARSKHVIEWAGDRVTKVRKGLAAAAERAGLKRVTPHLFRHTAAVWMAEGGSSMGEIADFLGHSDDRITQRVYAKFSPTHQRKQAAILNIGGVRRAVG